jgi:hypothetical protein
MTGRELLHELHRYERLLGRAIDAYNVGDLDEMANCLANCGEGFGELIETAESEGLST